MNRVPQTPVGKFSVLVIVCGIALFMYLNGVKTRISRPSVTQSGTVESLLREQPSKTATLADVVAAPLPERGPKPNSLMAGASHSRGEPVSKSDPEVTEVSAEKEFSPGQIFFRYTAPDSNFGKLAVTDYPNMSSFRFVADFSCEVLHVAAGVGICLTADRGVFTKYGADLFDSTFKRLFHFDLKGIPSRSRVSPDGKVAALTVFQTGHSYASVDFSTQTLLIDTTSGEILGDLEEFAVSLDGQPFKSRDFNFWGVTFTPDSKGFYCTLSSKGKHFLAKGDIKSRTLSVVGENVECPSMSPDGAKIAYKKRQLVSGRPSWIPAPQVRWRLHVLDLATMNDIPLAEVRSVDDQLAWLDNFHVLYALPATPTDSSQNTNIWMIPVDGGAPSKLFLPSAYSPSVVR
jgi:hypothetical protein